MISPFKTRWVWLRALTTINIQHFNIIRLKLIFVRDSVRYLGLGVTLLYVWHVQLTTYWEEFSCCGKKQQGLVVCLWAF